MESAGRGTLLMTRPAVISLTSQSPAQAGIRAIRGAAMARPAVSAVSVAGR